ncbi:MAG: GNAT family N-acetyltransferase [Thermofilaceae archaeon]
MDVRSLSEDPGLYDEVRKLINRALFNDFVDRRFFRLLTVDDPNFDPKLSLVCVRNGKVVATAMGIRRVKEPSSMVDKQREIAWIKVLACPPDHTAELRNLTAVLEEELRRSGARMVRVSDYASWYLSPGIDLEYEWLRALLEHLGYRKVGEAVNYEVDMSKYRTPSWVQKLESELKQQEFILREATTQDQDRLYEWIERFFSPFWRIEAELAMRSEEGGVLIAEKGGVIAGFSVYGALRPDFFGPIGVDPGVRGRGLGTVLLFRSLERMREEGVRVATIPWTLHLTFYAQVPGVTKIRLFNVMAKELA